MEQRYNKYFTELERALRKQGISATLYDNGRFMALHDGQEACRVAPSGEVLRSADFTFNEEVNELYHRVTLIADEVQEYTRAHEEGEEFNQGYRMVCSCNRTVLGVKQMEDGFAFVTWSQDPDGGYSGGNYTRDFAGAKADFVKRAGLLPAERLFTNEQLIEMSRCIADTLEGSYALHPEQTKLLEDLQRQLEEAVPSYRQLMEQSIEKSQESLSAEQTM